jgi:hypothetical protein
LRMDVRFHTLRILSNIASNFNLNVFCAGYDFCDDALPDKRQ